MIDVLLIDGQLSWRQVVAVFLRAQPDFGQVIECGSAEEVRSALARPSSPSGFNPLLIMLALHEGLTDGVALLPELRLLAPRATVVVIDGIEDADYLSRLVDAGVDALLSRRATIDQIVGAARRALLGTVQIDSELAIRLMRATPRERQDRERLARMRASVSQRELELLRLVARGHTDGEIARLLEIDEETVRTHLANVLRKLHVANRTAAILFVIRHGMIPLQ